MKKIIGSHGWRKLSMVLFLLLIVSVCAFSQTAAQSDTDTFGLNTHVNTILTLLNSPWVKGIACIALIIECIGLVTMGRQEPGMWKKFVPWIAGTVLFMAAGKITGTFMQLNPNITTDLTTTTGN